MGRGPARATPREGKKMGNGRGVPFPIGMVRVRGQQTRTVKRRRAYSEADGRVRQSNERA